MTSIHRLLDPADPLAAVTQLGSIATINQGGQIASAGMANGEWQMALLTPVPGSALSERRPPSGRPVRPSGSSPAERTLPPSLSRCWP